MSLTARLCGMMMRGKLLFVGVIVSMLDEGGGADLTIRIPGDFSKQDGYYSQAPQDGYYRLDYRSVVGSGLLWCVMFSSPPVAPNGDDLHEFIGGKLVFAGMT